MISSTFRQRLTNSMKLVAPSRYFHLHEYQAKSLMRAHNISVQKGDIALNVDQASQICSELSPKAGLIVKAQVHAGGRGKGTLTSGLKGGVQICKSVDKVKEVIGEMIGYKLITRQTSKEGLEVKCVLIHEGVEILQEFYLSIIMDRKHGPAILASKYGGMDIEEVARQHPKSILLQPLHTRNAPDLSLEYYLPVDLGHKLLNSLDIYNIDEREIAIGELNNLINMFVKTDALMLEINPWAIISTKEGATGRESRDIICVDAKINIDDNAKYRQNELYEISRKSLGSEEIDVNEREAEDVGINYVSLGEMGNIGCMVNGAGLAMATMDLITLYGGYPANFLDVGGGADPQHISIAFQLLLSSTHLRAIFVNIFGGIMRCDLVAQGIVQALGEVQINVPLIVRLHGTFAQLGNIYIYIYRSSNYK